MGWCSATAIFDAMCEGLLNNEPKDIKQALSKMVQVLEENDWDCQQDSEFWDHLIVQEIMKELHPGWFENEE